MAATAPANAVLSFGVYEVDLHSEELRKCGVKIRIQEMPFQALKLLLSHPHEVVSREDLRRALWPDGIYVDFDRGVISAINRLRETLGDSAEKPAFIETVGRRGYRWIAPVHVSGAETLSPGVAPPASKRSSHWKYLAVAVPLIVAVSLYLAYHPPTPSARFSRVKAPGNPEAQEFFLKGRYYWEKRTPESLQQAVDAFTQVIVRDPDFAPAYVGLANCYNLLREFTLMPSSEAYPRAFAAARKAVELDPESSEAHASLAFVSFYGMWDVATADREFRRSLALDPNNSVAHHWYATYLSCLQRYDEALAEINRAQALDPASRSILADKGSLLFAAGHVKDAIGLLRQMEAAEPDFISPHRYLKSIYLQSAQYSRYLEEARKEAALMNNQAALALVNATEKGFAAGGGRRLLEILIAQQKQLCDRDQFSPVLLAETYALKGNKTQSLHYLQIAFDRHTDGLEQIASDHAFASLRDNAAFQQLLARIIPSRQAQATVS